MDAFVPSQAMSLDEFYDKYYETHKLAGLARSTHSAESWVNDIFNPTQTKHIKNEYDAYLKNLENQNNAAQAKWLADYNAELDASKYQRAAADLQKAGLNPWLALQSGLNGSSTPLAESSSALSYRDHGKKENSKSAIATLLGTALKVLAFMALK